MTSDKKLKIHSDSDINVNSFLTDWKFIFTSDFQNFSSPLITENDKTPNSGIFSRPKLRKQLGISDLLRKLSEMKTSGRSIFRKVVGQDHNSLPTNLLQFSFQAVFLLRFQESQQFWSFKQPQTRKLIGKLIKFGDRQEKKLKSFNFQELKMNLEVHPARTKCDQHISAHS